MCVFFARIPTTALSRFSIPSTLLLATTSSNRELKSDYRAPPSPPGAVFTKPGLAALPVRHSWVKEA
jgi:hypothetical protein